MSTLIKSLINNVKNQNNTSVKQLFILTHNVFFHKEISFIDSRRKECVDTHFWILRKLNKTTSLQTYEMKNPVQTSYTLLWEELRHRDKSSKISIQNTMRRIIENYFKLLGKYGDDNLISQFPTYEEQEICRSLVSWINDGSHTITDDLYVEKHDDLIEKYFNVFKNIFVYTKHEEHFNMMMNAN